jgi:nucleotide-binding universal stress UspA family protein
MEMRIVVATDGQPDSIGALRVAHALARSHHASVHVVGAVPPFPFPASPVGDLGAKTIHDLERAAAEALRARIEHQLADIGSSAGWLVTVEFGPPAPTLVRLAHARNASLIALGLGRHGVTDRIFGSETALQVMRLAHVPVLGVPADAHGLPRTAVVAMDFSAFSRDAAEAAVALVAPRGTIHLAHILWKPVPAMPAVAGPEWIDSYLSGAGLQLQEVARMLEVAADLRVETHLLEGDPADEVLRLAGAVGADLIAAGSHGAGFFSRLVMGSVSTRLLRRAGCAVLIAPPRTIPEELGRVWSEGKEAVARTAAAARSGT